MSDAHPHLPAARIDGRQEAIPAHGADSIRKPALLAALGILVLFAAAMLFVFLVTRTPAPVDTFAERSDARGGVSLPVPPFSQENAPGLTTPGGMTSEPEARDDGSAMAREGDAEPALDSPLQGEPVAPLPSDPRDRAEALAAVRAQRLMRMLEQRDARAAAERGTR